MIILLPHMDPVKAKLNMEFVKVSRKLFCEEWPFPDERISINYHHLDILVQNQRDALHHPYIHHITLLDIPEFLHKDDNPRARAQSCRHVLEQTGMQSNS
jgi:hypothetical protein